MSLMTRKRTSLLLLMPLVMWLVLFALVPLGYGFWLSLHDARLATLHSPRWVGLRNYQTLINSEGFYNSLRWSLGFAISSVAVEMIVGMSAATLFNRKFPGKGLAITLFMIPLMISPVLMGTMFRLLFHEAVGPIAYLLSGITGTTALLGMRYVNYTLVGANMINRTPMVFLNTYSAMQGVSADLLEAATVDGCNSWQRWRNIILPFIFPIVGITFLERILQNFVIFEMVFALSGGGPGTFTQSVSIFVYRRAFERSDFGMANAASFFIAIILLIPALYLVRKMVRNDN